MKRDMQDTYKHTFEEKLNWLCNKANDILVHDHTSCKERSTDRSLHQFHVSCDPPSFRFGYQHATSEDYAAIIKEVKDFVSNLDVSNPKHSSALENILRATELRVKGQTPAELKQAVLAYDSGITLKAKEPVIKEYKEYVAAKTYEFTEAGRKHAVEKKLNDILEAGLKTADKDPNYSGFLLYRHADSLGQTDPELIPTVDMLRENYVLHQKESSQAQTEQPRDVKVAQDYFTWTAAAIAGAGILALICKTLSKKKKSNSPA